MHTMISAALLRNDPSFVTKAVQAASRIHHGLFRLSDGIRNLKRLEFECDR